MPYKPYFSGSQTLLKVSSLRWLCTDAARPHSLGSTGVGAAFFHRLCSSERYHERLGKRHKTLTDWARQMIRQVRRWLPGRPIVIAADSAFAALDFLFATRPHATINTRSRLDAALYAPAPFVPLHAMAVMYVN